MIENYQPKAWNNKTPYNFALKRIICLDSICEHYSKEKDYYRQSRSDKLCESYFSRFSEDEQVEILKGALCNAEYRKMVEEYLGPYTEEELEEVVFGKGDEVLKQVLREEAMLKSLRDRS